MTFKKVKKTGYKNKLTGIWKFIELLPVNKNNFYLTISKFYIYYRKVF
jgi:hypothetical protein